MGKARGLSVEHFNQNLSGYCTYRAFYKWAAKQVPLVGARCIELGPAYGQGVAYLAVELINRGCTGARIDMVDIGDAETLRRNLAHVASVIGDVWTENSWDAAAHYPDGYFDLVFIDANHSKPCVLQDIAAWRRKVKPGGILGGHDHSTQPDLAGVIDAVVESFERYTVVRGERFGDEQKFFPAWYVIIGENGAET